MPSATPIERRKRSPAASKSRSPRLAQTLPLEYRNDDVTSKLIGQFRDMIADRTLLPGTRLPAERDLARSFSVSRNSLRQALKVLEIMGVVRQKMGSGTYLSEDASSILTEAFRFLLLMDSISHEELYLTRLMMEPELAARAAENATLEHLRQISRAIESMKAAGNHFQRVIEADVEFHNRIFEAAGSRVCQAVFTVLHRALLQSLAITSREVNVSHTLRFHQQIYQAIFDRTPERARQLMREHIEDAHAVMRTTQTKARVS
ncbi:MAG: FadR family transcriptional regulator [Bryobacter sp.]|jgi:GntR family transcriptional repressor for pyruvate dehydrogenase complex|nr:FadR family transcriptional regulator [Bryobacter sp. CoA8 C33]